MFGFNMLEIILVHKYLIQGKLKVMKMKKFVFLIRKTYYLEF